MSGRCCACSVSCALWVSSQRPKVLAQEPGVTLSSLVSRYLNDSFPTRSQAKLTRAMPVSISPKTAP
eukprot:6239939-Pyramimonas_sp.AAC.1